MHKLFGSRIITDSCVLIMSVAILSYLSSHYVIFSFILSAVFFVNCWADFKLNSAKMNLALLDRTDYRVITNYEPLIPSSHLVFLAFPYIRVIFLFLLVSYLVQQTEFSVIRIFSEIKSTAFLFKGVLTPEWSLFGEAVVVYASQTVEIALLGTILAFLTALPLSVLMSRNTAKVLNVSYLYAPIRAMLSITRAIPTFLLGLIFVALVGLGPMPGVLAIYVFSVGIMAKQFSESIESLSSEPAEAIQSVSGTRFHTLFYGYAVQGSPLIIAHLFYCFEINIHSATVLGLIGAEGIGLPIHEYITAFAYSEAAVFIIVVIIMTVATDWVSNYIRHKII